MTRNTTRRLVSLSAITALSTLLVTAFAAAAQAVTIPTVPVGNLGNALDPSTGNLYGGVAYNYRIATTEVTNAQYAEFLNFKAASDPLGLYSTSMGGDARGGIRQSGVSGSYSYTTKTNMADKPVNYVSWYDAIRFANWLHNGQGSGDTETGAYMLERFHVPCSGIRWLVSADGAKASAKTAIAFSAIHATQQLKPL